MRPPPVPQQEGDGSAPVTPTTPTTPITPTTHGGQPGIQPGSCVFVGRYWYYMYSILLCSFCTTKIG